MVYVVGDTVEECICLPIKNALRQVGSLVIGQNWVDGSKNRHLATISKAICLEIKQL